MKLHPLYIYRGIALLAQVAFYRAVSLELGNEVLGIFAQMLGIAILIAACVRFGCETAISHVLFSADAKVSDFRAIGLSYVVEALKRTLILAIPFYAALVVIFDVDIRMLLFSALFAVNLTFSFLERSLNQQFTMVIMDVGSTFTILVFLYYTVGWIAQTPESIFTALVIFELTKLASYSAINAKYFERDVVNIHMATITYRTRYAFTDIFSVVANYGIQIFLPLVLGASNAGVFFLLQRLANPITFVLNVLNSIVTARILRDRKSLRLIYISSVKELSLVGTLLTILIVLVSVPLLSFFGLSNYGLEYALITLGTVISLFTGASAPVFNSVGRPLLNLIPNLVFIAIFYPLVLGLSTATQIDVLHVVLVFLAGRIALNASVVLGLLKLRKEAVL